MGEGRQSSKKTVNEAGVSSSSFCKRCHSKAFTFAPFANVILYVTLKYDFIPRRFSHLQASSAS